MKNYETPWTVGSMFICNKCGAAFDKPKNAEELKTELRTHLKDQEAHKKIRVMVTGCLNICEKEEQAVMYQPVEGPTEVFTTDKGFKSSLNEIKEFIQKKI